ncbi:MAG TPA: DinB family protein [Terriglobales bacterium]|nr:DinB family protein [Terriglobales bacterium]
MRDQATQALRQHLYDLLRGGHAHLPFDEAIARFPARLRGVKAKGAPHTAWQLLEHLRIAQWDILEFSRNRKHVSPKFPEGYWPATAAPPSGAAWNRSVAAFRRDLKAMQALVRNPRTDLFARIPWGDGQTLLREALLVADHNAYHLGQLVLLRRLLGTWTEG